MRVLLVEDEPDLGAAVERALVQAKYVVDWFQDGASAWAALEQPAGCYTVAILDWLLPAVSGLVLCQRLRAAANPLPVLMLTARDRLDDRVAGLDAGADDYLVKPFGMAELLARLRALQRRSPQLQSLQLTVGPLTLDAATATVHHPTGATLTLTAKEFQLLDYFMRHPHQILSREQIQAQLWELAAEPSSNVVAAQIRLLRRKLAELGLHSVIETVYGLGYRLTVPE